MPDRFGLGHLAQFSLQLAKLCGDPGSRHRGIAPRQWQMPQCVTLRFDEFDDLARRVARREPDRDAGESLATPG